MSHRSHYFAGIMRFVLSALVFRPLIVVPWINTRQEQWMVRLLQMCRLRSLIVVHNPVPRRDETNKLIDAIRASASAIIVHRPEFVCAMGTQARCIPHPAYFGWLRAVSGERGVSLEVADSVQRSASLSALYLGALREDKGAEFLPFIADEVRRMGGASLRIVTGSVDSRWMPVLQDCVSRGADLTTDPSEAITDTQLFRELAQADVLLAPYIGVTASGTIMQALTVGVPVVAFDSEHLSDLRSLDLCVTPNTSGALLARAVDVVRDSPDVRSVARSQDNEARRLWSSAVLFAQKGCDPGGGG